MTIDHRRRRVLKGACALAALPLVPPARAAGPGEASYALRAAPASVSMLGAGNPATGVWAYEGQVPGPVLRVRQGEPIAVRVANGLGEPTTVHWHGLRIPNAMDGVPNVTQPPIAPGGAFEYAFVPPDAGTFWYHPHSRSNEQVDRGLHGALIVEEREPVDVDRDVLWVLDDWRLRRDGQIADDFDSPMDRTHAGRIGNTVTINGALPDRFELTPGERVRLRIASVANARIFALAFEGHAPSIVARDGMPCEPHAPPGGRVVLGPGMRADLVLDATAGAGTTHRVVDDFYRGEAYELVVLAYRSGGGSRAVRPPLRLPPNPVAEPDLANAERHVVTFEGGMMGGGPGMGMGMGRGMRGMPGAGGVHAWTINGVSATESDHVHDPALRLALGRSYVLRLRNETAWWHPIHLHGHAFRVLRPGRGSAGAPPSFVDTALLAPRETADIAFVADNPGDWMFHCHVLEHQASGMMATIRVA